MYSFEKKKQNESNKRIIASPFVFLAFFILRREKSSDNNKPKVILKPKYFPF